MQVIRHISSTVVKYVLNVKVNGADLPNTNFLLNSASEIEATVIFLNEVRLLIWD